MTIATFDRAHLIGAAIERVLAQTESDFELLIVDDGSTDDTARTAKAYAADRRVRVVSQENVGLCGARNTGARASRGRHIIFLDDDDLPDPDWLAAFRQELAMDHPAVVCCGLRVVHQSNGPPVETMLPQPVDPLLGTGRGLFLPGTFSVRRDVFEASGGFLVGLDASHQTEYSWRLLPLCRRQGWQIRAIDRVLISLVRRPPTDRAEVSPVRLLSGMERILESHASYLAQRPRIRANFSAVVGVAASRVGDGRTARQHLLRALRSDPLSARHWGRLVVALSPSIRRRVWGIASNGTD